MPHHHATMGSWEIALALTFILASVASTYLRGWLLLRSTDGRTQVWRAGSFLCGLLLIWIAVASPLAALDHQWLTVHMIQHLLLMTLAPPLVWLGAPSAVLRARAHTPPTLCWLAAAFVLVGWHVPAVFTLGMQSPAWHTVERASFLVAGLLFWLP